MQRRDSMKEEFERSDRVRARFLSCPDIASIKTLLKESETNEVSKSIPMNSIKSFIDRKERQIKTLMERQTGYVREQKAKESIQTGKLIQIAMGEVKEAQQLVSSLQTAIYKDNAQQSIQKVLDLDVDKTEKKDLLLAKMELQRMSKAIYGNKNYDPNRLETTNQLRTISTKMASIEKAIENKSKTLEDVFNIDNSPKNSPLRK